MLVKPTRIVEVAWMTVSGSRASAANGTAIVRVAGSTFSLPMVAVVWRSRP